MLTFMTIVTIGVAVWVGVRYRAPGTIGASGMAVAALPLLYVAIPGRHQFVILAIAAVLFVIGMLVKKNDYRYHFAALFINVAGWIWLGLSQLWNWSGLDASVSYRTLVVLVAAMVMILVLIALTVGWNAYEDKLRRQRTTQIPQASSGG